MSEEIKTLQQLKDEKAVEFGYADYHQIDCLEIEEHIKDTIKLGIAELILTEQFKPSAPETGDVKNVIEKIMTDTPESSEYPDLPHPHNLVKSKTFALVSVDTVDKPDFEAERFYNLNYSGTETSEFLKPYVINSYKAGVKATEEETDKWYKKYNEMSETAFSNSNRLSAARARIKELEEDLALCQQNKHVFSVEPCVHDFIRVEATVPFMNCIKCYERRYINPLSHEYY
jgi:hypothetical protein